MSGSQIVLLETEEESSEVRELYRAFVVLPGSCETRTNAASAGQNLVGTWHGVKTAWGGVNFLTGSPGRIELKQNASLQAAQDLLAEYADLQPNWNSYGALQISPVANQEARRLLFQLFESYGQAGIPDTIVPLADGGLQFEWDKRGGTLEMEIQSDRILSTLLIRPGQPVEEREGITWQDVRRILAPLLT